METATRERQACKSERERVAILYIFFLCKSWLCLWLIRLQVWKQKAQYIQHKQNKAEATTVKRKSSPSESSSKIKGIRTTSWPTWQSASLCTKHLFLWLCFPFFVIFLRTIITTQEVPKQSCILLLFSSKSPRYWAHWLSSPSAALGGVFEFDRTQTSRNGGNALQRGSNVSQSDDVIEMLNYEHYCGIYHYCWKRGEWIYEIPSG